MKPTGQTYKTVLQNSTVIFIATIVLAGCSGLGYTPPPGAKLGDGFLSLTVSTDDRLRMPQGADLVISIENAAAIDEKNKVIIGDVVKLSQPDTDVKVNFPIDQHLLMECGKTKPCQIHVKVAKSGSIRYVTSRPLPYKAGQSQAKVTVTKPS